MKKQLLVLTLALSSMSFAQLINYADGGTSIANGGTVTANVTGNTNYVPNYDVMGAHENGGRGCAACHAPHNGAKGNGGNPLGSGYGASVSNQGGLWGEDTTNIIAYGTITFNGGLSAHSGVLTIDSVADNTWSSEVYKGVATCLSCHDGKVAEGAMMSGISYEQAFGLLNGVSGVSTGISANRNTSAITTTTLYGPNAIPTLLGGGTGLGYNYTHPVGQTANVGAVLGSILSNANYGLTLGTTTRYGSTVLSAQGAANTPYGIFMSTYTPSALNSMVYESTNSGKDSWVACTTCHNQHNMAVAKLSSSLGTQARTIFFVNGAYNPGAPYDPTHEPSTMRFCQQCHFSFSSEYYGATNVGTAY